MPKVTTVEPDGAAVKRHRELAGLTQEDLARLTHRSVGSIIKIESNYQQKRWGLILMIQIAHAIKARPERIIRDGLPTLDPDPAADGTEAAKVA